jgi:hypothetical protein
LLGVVVVEECTKPLSRKSYMTIGLDTVLRVLRGWAETEVARTVLPVYCYFLGSVCEEEVGY